MTNRLVWVAKRDLTSKQQTESTTPPPTHTHQEWMNTQGSDWLAVSSFSDQEENSARCRVLTSGGAMWGCDWSLNGSMRMLWVRVSQTEHMKHTCWEHFFSKRGGVHTQEKVLLAGSQGQGLVTPNPNHRLQGHNLTTDFFQHWFSYHFAVQAGRALWSLSVFLYVLSPCFVSTH